MGTGYLHTLVAREERLGSSHYWTTYMNENIFGIFSAYIGIEWAEERSFQPRPKKKNVFKPHLAHCHSLAYSQVPAVLIVASRRPLAPLTSLTRAPRPPQRMTKPRRFRPTTQRLPPTSQQRIDACAFCPNLQACPASWQGLQIFPIFQVAPEACRADGRPRFSIATCPTVTRPTQRSVCQQNPSRHRSTHSRHLREPNPHHQLPEQRQLRRHQSRPSRRATPTMSPAPTPRCSSRHSGCKAVTSIGKCSASRPEQTPSADRILFLTSRLLVCSLPMT